MPTDTTQDRDQTTLDLVDAVTEYLSDFSFTNERALRTACWRAGVAHGRNPALLADDLGHDPRKDIE